MFSWTTVDSIWLSGFGGMLTTPVASFAVHPSFSTYALSSGPVAIVSKKKTTVAAACEGAGARTGEVEVGAEAVRADARERGGDGADGDLADGVLEADALDGVVVAERLDVVGAVEGPEGGEAALLEERVERGEHAELRRERVRLFRVRSSGGAVVEQGDAEVEVGEGGGGERFDEDVDHDVRVVEVGVELVPVADGVVGQIPCDCLDGGGDGVQRTQPAGTGVVSE